MRTQQPEQTKIPLTRRQQEVYQFIYENIGFYGPTVREIAAALGIKSPNGVVCHLSALEKRDTSAAAGVLVEVLRWRRDRTPQRPARPG